MATDFVAEKTAGWEALAETLRSQPWEPLVEQSGATREQMSDVAGLPRPMITHHRVLGHGAHAAQECCRHDSRGRQSAPSSRGAVGQTGSRGVCGARAASSDTERPHGEAS